MSNQPYNEPVATDPGWTDDDGLFVNEPSTAFPPDSLVTFRFLRDAVRRHLLIWLVLAVVGLLGGIASTFVLPQPHVSSTRLLLTHTAKGHPPSPCGLSRPAAAHGIALFIGFFFIGSFPGNE